MKNIYFLALFIVVGLLASCSPQIGTHIIKSYPQLSSAHPVEVYFNPDAVPENHELLGQIKVGDSGFSTNCDSFVVVNILKEETRKVGGNAVVVTSFKRPSFWGSSCYQMTGEALRINDFNSTATHNYQDTAIQTSDVRYSKPQIVLDRFTFSAGAGYGWRTAKISDNLNAFEKQFMKGLMSGYSWNVAANWFFHNNYGVGIKYQAYNATNSLSAILTLDDTSISGILKGNDLIYFVGPAFTMRGALDPAGKWIGYASYGLGYMDYISKGSIADRHAKTWGDTFGTQVDLGIDYKLNRNIGIGIKANLMGAALTKIHGIDWRGNSYVNESDKNSGESLSAFQIFFNLIYFIK